MVLVMSPVANSPSMVGHENGGVEQMPHDAVKLRVVRKAPVPTIMAENEESPEHGSLRNPIERPHYPVVKGRRGRGEPKYDHHVAHHVAHRPPRVLHPAMLGYGRSNLSQPERRRHPGVESCLLPVTPLQGGLPAALAGLPLILQGRHLQRRAHAERPLPAAAETDGRGEEGPPLQGLEASGG